MSINHLLNYANKNARDAHNRNDLYDLSVWAEIIIYLSAIIADGILES